MRNARNLSQTELELKIEPGSKRGNSRISKWENGDNADITAAELIALKQALDLKNLDYAYIINLLLTDIEADELTEEEKQMMRSTFSKYQANDYDLPAYIVNQYWDILDYNPHVLTVMGIPRKMGDRLFRSNLLDVLFNPVFGVTSAAGDENYWQVMMAGQVNRFKIYLSDFRHHKKYMKILYELVYRDNFLKLWYSEGIQGFNLSELTRFEIGGTKFAINVNNTFYTTTNHYSSIISWSVHSDGE
jgi:transcriptional regulator with XRE-family HTH domain